MAYQPLDELTMLRRALALQLASIDEQIAHSLSEQQRQAFKLLSPETIKSIVETQKGSLSVNEILMLSDISPATYYKTISDMSSVRVKSLESVLDTLGLQLYVGPKKSSSSE